MSFFELSGTWLGLFGKADLAKDAGLPLPPAPRPPAAGPHARFIGPTASLSHNLPSPEAVDRAFQEVERAGARIVKRPAKTDWGGYSGYFEDPDGHLWEFAHNPFFWPGPPPLSSTGRKEKARPPPKKRA